MMLPSLFALTGGLSVLTLVVSADDHLVSSRFTPAVGRPIKRGYQEDGTYVSLRYSYRLTTVSARGKGRDYEASELTRGLPSDPALPPSCFG
jgi:hypothetical protein